MRPRRAVFVRERPCGGAASAGRSVASHDDVVDIGTRGRHDRRIPPPDPHRHPPGGPRRGGPQPSAVAATDIGKDVGVQGVDHRPGGAPDRHPPDSGAAEPPAHGGQIRAQVAHAEAG
jgi:hypothetical protein